MNQIAIFFPVIALAGLTFAILLLIPYRRIKAVMLKEVIADDFKFGESKNVPLRVSLPNQNYINLLEIPVLFYVVCLMLYVTNSVDTVAVSLAWIYVILRVVHSVVHLTSNNIRHRLLVFGTSVFVLLALWIRVWIALSSHISS